MPGHAREHQVQDHKVMVALPPSGEAGFAVVSYLDLETIVQAVTDERGYALVIFDDEKGWSRGSGQVAIDRLEKLPLVTR